MEYKYRVECIVKNEDGQWVDRNVVDTSSVFKFVWELIKACRKHDYVRMIVRVK